MSLIVLPEDTLSMDLDRIVGGMAWPGDRPGFAVVVGEERLPRKGAKGRHCHILADSITYNKADFLREIGELQALYSTLAFYGRSEPSNLVHLYLYNSSAVKHGLAAIDFAQAPYSDNGKLELYSDIIINRLLPTNKSLHLGSADISKHLNIAPDERTSATCHTHPAVAALGYAIAVLELYEPVVDDDDSVNYREDFVDQTTGY